MSDRWSIRAFRPSHFAGDDEYDEDGQRAKEANVQLYTQRVEAGLPLFDNVRILRLPNRTETKLSLE